MKRVLIAAAMLLSACATPYQPEGYTGGFSEIPVGKNAVKIAVSGNGFTTPSRVNEMGLLRAAELAHNSGFNYFEILDLGEYQSVSSYTTPGSSQTTTTANATAYSYGNTTTVRGTANSYTTYTPPQTTTVIKPGVDIIVRYVSDQDAPARNALSVDQIFTLYAKKYGLNLE